jgi:hypothetical protein
LTIADFRLAMVQSKIVNRHSEIALSPRGNFNGDFMLYLLNTPILTAHGTWVFTPLALDDAKAMLQQGWQSAIGHQGTAELLSALLATEIPMNRVSITMQTGDEAVIFRVKTRLPEGQVLSREEIENLDYEFGLLKKTA